MLEVGTGNEIILHPCSDTDLKLKGHITLNNPYSNIFIPFKIKSTNVTCFQVNPSKGMLIPNQTIKVTVVTNQQVDSEYARILSQKHKFLVEYAIVNSRSSDQQILQKLRGESCQSLKIYINTNRIRGSKISKPPKENSTAESHRYSYNSFNNPSSISPQKKSQHIIQLKSQISYLQKQKNELSKRLNGKNSNRSIGTYKYFAILGVGLIFGNVVSKYSGLSDCIKSNINASATLKQEDEGFLSIFSFGDSNQIVASSEIPKSQESWWNVF